MPGPNEAQHLNQAQENEALAGTLIGSHNDWAATCLFYAALHYVDMYFTSAAAPPHFTSHGMRNSAIMATLTPIWAAYNDLLEESRLARYDCVDADDQTVRTLRDDRLRGVKAYLRTVGANIP